ncbi:hypothetical protein [Deinococcus sp. UYEF24]
MSDVPGPLDPAVPATPAPPTSQAAAGDSAAQGSAAQGQAAASTLLELNVQSREQRRRLNEARAREHVGAAGWHQTTLLEEIIRAGRDQFASTDALRQVVQLTTESLRALPLAAGQERGGQRRTLEEIVRSGHQQVSAAQELEEVIQQALGEIIETPISDLSARQLNRVLERVQEQIRALNLMIEAARAQVGTLEQLQELDDVSVSYQQRLGALHHLSAEEELEMLGNVGEQVAERIAELGVGGDRQLDTLGNISGAVVRQMAETTASKDDQLQALEQVQTEARQQARKLHEELSEAEGPADT